MKGGGLTTINSFPETDEHTESICVELQYNTTQGLQKLLLNFSYNPNKKKHNKFLDSTALQIDAAVSKKKSVILMGDYNINYLNNKERNNIDTVLIPYDLKVVNTKPTQGKNLIDYIITEVNFQMQSAHTLISEIKTYHQAVGMITQERTTKKRKPIIKTFFDKSNYSIKDFTSELKIYDWNSVYKMESIEESYSQFNSILSSVIQKHAPLVKKFVRSDKTK